MHPGFTAWRYYKNMLPSNNCSSCLNSTHCHQWDYEVLFLIAKNICCAINSCRNNECPACRTHCASRRSLRDDPNFDALVAAIYPDLDKYEEEVGACKRYIQDEMYIGWQVCSTSSREHLNAVPPNCALQGGLSMCPIHPVLCSEKYFLVSYSSGVKWSIQHTHYQFGACIMPGSRKVLDGRWRSWNVNVSQRCFSATGTGPFWRWSPCE